MEILFPVRHVATFEEVRSKLFYRTKIANLTAKISEITLSMHLAWQGREGSRRGK